MYEAVLESRSRDLGLIRGSRTRSRKPELLNTSKNGSREPGARSFYRGPEPEPVKEIKKNGFQEPGVGPVLEGAGSGKIIL